MNKIDGEVGNIQIYDLWREKAGKAEFSHFPQIQTFEKMRASSILKGLSQKPQCSHALASNANICESAQLVLSAVPRLNSFIMRRNEA